MSGDPSGTDSLIDAAPALVRFFATAEFRRFLIELGREEDRFRSLNLIVRENRRMKELLEKEEHLYAFLRQRALGLVALRYLLWMENELDRDECARAAPQTVVDSSVGAALLDPKLANPLADVFEYDVFEFEPEGGTFRRVECLETDERLGNAAAQAQKHLEERIGEAFDELRES